MDVGGKLEFQPPLESTILQSCLKSWASKFVMGGDVEWGTLQFHG